MEVDEEIKALRSEGKTYREICEALKVSPKQVRAALKQGENDPLVLLERKAELEERKAKALRRIEKARETLNAPSYELRLAGLETWILNIEEKMRDLESRISRVEREAESSKSDKTFKEEIEYLIELQKLDYLAAETRKRLWGF
jgi:predicted ArsR family transcriptional regulator